MSDLNVREEPPLTRRAVERTRLFYTKHPAGAVRTAVCSLGDALVVRAAVYRHHADPKPAATALTAWRCGGRSVDLGDAESRAIYRALGYFGIRDGSVRDGAMAATAPPAPPAPPAPVSTADARGRSGLPPAIARRDGPADDDPYESRRRTTRAPDRGRPSAAPPGLRETVADLDALITSALRAGLRPTRAQAWRAALGAVASTPATPATLERAERRLRQWIARREPL